MDNKFILFVFSAEGNNRHAFSFAVDLAIKKKAELILLTKTGTPVIIRNNSISLTELFRNCLEDELYLQILDLKGYYLSFNGMWHEGFPVTTINRFVTDELNTELEKTLNEFNISDLVISVSSTQTQLKEFPDLDKLLNNTKKNLWIFYKDGLQSSWHPSGFNISDTFLN